MRELDANATAIAGAQPLEDLAEGLDRTTREIAGEEGLLEIFLAQLVDHSSVGGLGRQALEFRCHHRQLRAVARAVARGGVESFGLAPGIGGLGVALRANPQYGQRVVVLDRSLAALQDHRLVALRVLEVPAGHRAIREVAGGPANVRLRDAGVVP